MDGVIAIPSTMIKLNNTELQKAIDFESIHGQSFNIMDINPTVTHRMMYSVAAHLDRPVMTSDISDVENRLQSTWSSQLSETITVSIELQESLVKDNGYEYSLSDFVLS